MEEIRYKQCSKCGRLLAFDKFVPRKNRRDGIGGICRECRNAYRSTHTTEDDREKARESVHKWKKKNPERAREAARQWRKNNPEKARESVHKWKKKNPEKARESALRWRKNNPERARETTLRWRKNNPEKVRAADHRRSAKKPCVNLATARLIQCLILNSK